MTLYTLRAVLTCMWCTCVASVASVKMYHTKFLRHRQISGSHDLNISPLSGQIQVTLWDINISSNPFHSELNNYVVHLLINSGISLAVYDKVIKRSSNLIISSSQHLIISSSTKETKTSIGTTVLQIKT